jgi:pyridoxal phosphate enzyme (YggS family)
MTDSDVWTNLERVRATIAQAAQRSGRRPEDITLVAVTKMVPLERIIEALVAGVTDLGENRVQELKAKAVAMARLWDGPTPRWHMVGHLQTNKVKATIGLVAMIHSVDSLELAQHISRRCVEQGKILPVLLEINVAGEATKFGYRLDDRDRLYAEVEAMVGLPGLILDGLMTVAPVTTNLEEVRPVFRRLAQMREDLRQRYPGCPWTHLSMGMTDDYPVAIEEGATMIRLGRAIFGERLSH